MWASRALVRCHMSVLSSSSLASASSTSCRGYPHTPTGLPSFEKTAHCFLQYRCVVYNKITKNKLLMNKQRDAAYENFMDDEKRVNLMQRIIKLLLKQPEKKMLYRYMLRRGGYVGLVKPQKMGDILQKYPRIIRIYRNPNEIDVWVSLSKPILQLLEEEKTMKQERAHLAAERLRKVLMMSTTRRIRLDRINYLKEELGLPDDFKKTVIRAHPHLFKLVISRVDLHKGVSPSVKLLEWDDKLAVPVIDAYRQDPATTSGLDEEERKRKDYSFPINFPPGFKIKKALRHKLRKWQELPYQSPYEDASDLDLKSEEALKRAVAVVHEFLHITVEKRTRIDRLAHLRADYKLPQKLGVTVLQNPGIFYMSTKSNVQTIFLREGYKKGELINKDALFSLKDKFMALIKMGRKSIKKTKRGPYAISDSDTSEDEMENDGKCEEVDNGKDKEGDEREGRGIGEEREEEGEDSGEDNHIFARECDGDEEDGVEEGNADDEDEDCVHEDANDYKDDVDIVDQEDEDCSNEDENEMIFEEDEKGGVKDPFDTEDDTEGCSDHESGHDHGQVKAGSQGVNFLRRAKC
eukprot:c11398_g1_i1 orf=84-1817(-)